MNLGSKKKMRFNQEKILYIFTKFQKFLNFRVRDLPSLDEDRFGSVSKLGA